MSYPVRDARRRIRERHRSVVDEINDCADRVAAPWDTSRTTNPDAVVDQFHAALAERGVLERLAHVLADVAEATGYQLHGRPVPAPPYVVVTSRGPVLRGTLDPGRLVIEFDAFEVIRDSEPGRTAAYRRRNGVQLEISLE